MPEAAVLGGVLVSPRCVISLKGPASCCENACDGFTHARTRGWRWDKFCPCFCWSSSGVSRRPSEDGIICLRGKLYSHDSSQSLNPGCCWSVFLGYNTEKSSAFFPPNFLHEDVWRGTMCDSCFLFKLVSVNVLWLFEKQLKAVWSLVVNIYCLLHRWLKDMKRLARKP